MDDFDAAVGAAMSGPPADPAQSARFGMQQASGTNPDLYAELRRVAQVTGVPIGTVQADPETAKRQAVLGTIDFGSLAATAPSTAKLLSDVDTAKISHDDIWNLSGVEQAVRSFMAPRPQPGQVDTSRSVVTSAGFGQLVQQIKAQNPALDFDAARALALQTATVDDQSPMMGPAQRPAPTLTNLVRGLLGPEMWNKIGANIDVMSADAFGLDTDRFMRQRYAAGQAQESVSPGFTSRTAAGLYSGGVSIVQNAPGILASVLTGNPVPGLAYAGLTSGAEQYGDVRERGGTAGQAALAGTLTGATEVATELLPMSFLVNKLGKAGAGEFLKGLLARELPGEQLATLVQDAVDTAIANPDKTWKQYWEERPARAYETLLATLVQSGVMAGGHTVLEHTAMKAQAREYQAKAAEDTAKLLGGIMQMAAASKVRERDPDTFQGFLQQATQDGPLEHVYINPKEMQDAGVDLTQLEHLAPSAMPLMEQALLTGTDVAIPTAELATRLPGSELEQSVLQHLKTDPEGFSQVGAQAYMQQHGESMRQQVEQVLAEHKGDTAFKDSMKEVENHVLAQLKAANRFTDDVNAPYAAMWGAFFGVQAARVGTSPKQLFDQFAPKIVAQTAAGALLDQDVPIIPLRQGPAYSTAPANLMGFSTNKPSKAFGEQKYRHVQYIEVTTASGSKHVDAVTGLNEAHAMERARRNWSTSQVAAITEEQAVAQDPGIADDVKAAMANSALRQDKVDITRGSFDPATNTLALLKAADLSTFLHESGHFFLEVMADMASQPDAPAAIREDFATFLKWTGVADAAAWQAMTLDEKRAHHEDFARGFEAYLFEGKAPSIELQGLFQRFRAWLLNVYRSLAALNVHLTPDIRGVFDRMLATTEQIKLAEDVRGYEALFKNKPEGMTPDEWAVYQLQANDATQKAITELEARSLKDMKWLSGAKSRELKKLQAEAKARRDEVESEARTEVEALPVYQAMAAIKEQRQSDPADRTAAKEWTAAREAEQARLADVVKAETLAAPEAQGLKGLQKGQFLAKAKRAMANEVERRLLGWEKANPKPTVNIPEADLEAVAALHGFSSGDELARAMMEAPPAKDVIQGMTDQRMLERYGDLVSPEAIERAAEEAIHNDARLKFAATEANALRKATGEPALLAAAVRQFAADIVARTRVRDLRPSVFTAAERRAAHDAAKAARENDLQAAAVQKRNQLINGYAAQETLKAQDEVGRIAKYLRGFNRESVYKSLDGDYVDQIHALLERFELRDLSLKAIDKRSNLAAWLKAQEEAGLEPEIDEALVDESRRTSYKNLTVEELRGLRDAVKQIEHLGRLKHKLLTAKDKRDYEAARDAIVASIIEHAGDKVADNRTRPTALNAAGRSFTGALLAHRKIASLVREMDGFKDGGQLWEYFIRTMNEAGDREATMRAEATKKLFAIVKPMLDGGKRGGKGQFFPTVGMSLNREERLGIALNMGNAGNMQRLLDGEGWQLAQVKPVLDTLTAEDWKFVQNVWDFLESFRPQIAAKERRVYGKEPNWVEPQPLTVQTADGKTITLKGGYYPVKYDPARSGVAEQHDAAEESKRQMQGAYTSATTRRSFTKSRAEAVKGRPLMYSTDALFSGVNEIIHDLAWHEWLIDANKLMRSTAIDTAIRTRYGAQVMQQFKSAIKDIAAGEFQALHALEKVFGKMRVGAVVAGLGLNVVNSIINVQGITQSMVRIGPKWTSVGLGKFAMGPVALSQEVAAKSPFMASRAQTLNREVNEVQSLIRDKSALRHAVDRIMFLPLTVTQQLVDLPTWWGGYQKALFEGNDEARAVSLADQAVLDAQSGGQMKDLARIQRGGDFAKLWTTFYGFFSSTYQLAVEKTKATNPKDPAQILKLATDYMLLLVIPSLMGTLLKNLLTGGDWDEEKLAKKAIGDEVSYMMGLFVGVREFAPAVQTAMGVNEFAMGYGGPAGARFVGEVYKLAQQAHQGDIDGAFLKALDNVVGMLFRLPSGQINRTVEGTMALANGDTGNPLAVIAGPPPKN